MAQAPADILCVDDEPNVLRSLRRELSRLDYRIRVEESPEAALRLLDATRFAVVISDYRMPEMMGDEFLYQVRKKSPDTFRILLTGQADLEAVAAVINRGGLQRYLTKLWEEDELEQAVGQGIERFRLLQSNQHLMQALDERNRELQTLNGELEERVTARTRQLEQAYAELVHKEKLSALGRMAAGVVHEVLNPLSVVVGRLNMVLRHSDLADKSRRSVEVASEQTRRAAAILENLRDVSRQRPPQHTAIDMDGLIDQSLELLAPEFRQRGIEIHRLSPVDLPAFEADADQLAQVMLNLCKNAAEAMPEGGTLTLESAVDEGRLILRVADSGSGIAPEHLEKLFEPFFTTKETGTGLGLAICQGILEVHGGTIKAKNNQGKGAVFEISLPYSSD
jgi:signal transduction histidine kinase